ncbi:MAG: DUF2256 domain-containing protein [Candidatus Pacebacteria bacterium]|nr:DUF2256 domain-containing protein [Candidatus Paceibacterota bacterium]
MPDKRKKNIIAHTKESKICPTCNRIFYNRKRWSSRGIWDDIKYCSEKCRKQKTS